MGVRKDSVFFKGLPTESLSMLQEYMDNTNLTWQVFLFFFCFLGKVAPPKGMDLGRLGSEYDWGTLCETPK